MSEWVMVVVVVIDVYSKVSKDVNIRMRTIMMNWGRCDCDWRFLVAPAPGTSSRS